MAPEQTSAPVGHTQEVSATVARTRLGHLLSSLEFDERLYGHNPERSTLDFPHAIAIVKQAMGALDAIIGESP